ncbi:hypothetical protein CPB97_011030 [Podila verticillata]|nr:hypothetical protein CPB97_011030 [Podila verticillata]
MSAVTQLLQYLAQHATSSNTKKLALSLFLLIVYKYRSHAVGTRPRRDLKQPRAFPLVGHLFTLSTIPGSKLLAFYEKMHNEFGPVWSASLPGIGRMIQGDSPELVEHVLKTNFWSYEKGPILKDTMHDLFGEGIFQVDGSQWRSQRKLASHIFTVKAFKEYVSEVFVNEGHKVIEYLGKAADQGTIVDFHQLMLQFTLDSFGVVSFSESFGCLDNIEHEVPFAVSFDDLTTTCAERLVDPAWRIRERLTSVGAKAQYDKNLIAQHAYGIMERRRTEGRHQGDSKKKDLLDWFLEAKDDEGNPLPDAMIKDFILTFTIAGRDTTAQALSWMFYLLLRTETDPEVRQRLEQEVDEVLQGQEPTYETHKQQKYAEACLYEGLRLYPVVPRNMKHCIKDDVLPDGTKIYKGDWFSWSSYVMGRSTAIWGPDAREYKPARWINTEKPSQGKFNSFHAGPRVCLGQQFATIEALTIIGMILSKFSLELVHPGREPAYGSSVTMPMADGLPVRIYRRTNVPLSDI